MKISDERRDRLLPGQVACMPNGVHDARVAAAAKDHQSPVAEADDERLIVEDQWVCSPRAIVQRLVFPHPRLERRRAIDVAGDQHRASEQERGLALLNDREPHPFNRRPAGRGQLGQIEPRKAQSASAPEIWMNHHRQGGTPKNPD